MMVDFVKLQEDFYVAPQIQAGDIIHAKELGIRTIMVNRPEHEEVGQPTKDKLRLLAEAHDITFLELPVISGQITDNQVDAFATLLTSAQMPCLCYCRTGTRSTHLWALSHAQKLGLEHVMSAAMKAGYNLETIRERLILRIS